MAGGERRSAGGVAIAGAERAAAPTDDRTRASIDCFLAEATPEGFAKWQEWVRERCEHAQISGPVLADIAGKPYVFGHAMAPWFLHEQWKVGLGVEMAAQLYARGELMEQAPRVAVASAGGPPAGVPQAAARPGRR